MPAANQRSFDVVVVGGGAVGENLADRAVQGGLSAVVIEGELVGGACSYWACMPSKALLRPGAASAAARAVPGAGEVPGAIDVEATFDSRTAFTSNWDDSSQVEWLEHAGIELIRGSARITGPREVEVRRGIKQTGLEDDDDEVVTVKARVAVALCTGSLPTIPPIEGLVESRPWTSAEATATSDVPDDLLIIGGGVIACEMATAFADLGSRVHLVVRGGGLLSNLDDFVGEAVADSLRDMGVDIRFNTEVSTCEQVEAPQQDLIVDDAASVSSIRTKAALTDGSTIVADQVLVATGREPHLPEIEGIDLQRDEGGAVKLDDDMRAACTDWLYVVGDASSRAHTTHQVKYQSRIIGDLIARRASAADGEGSPDSEHADLRGDSFGAPQVVFTRPEVAHVGLTSDEASKRGLSVQSHDQDLGAIAGAALHAKGYSGRARFIVDTTSQTLIGATFVGPDTAEMLHSATIAIVGQVPLSKLWHAVPAYPTISEVWLRFLEGAGL